MSSSSLFEDFQNATERAFQSAKESNDNSNSAFPDLVDEAAACEDVKRMAKALAPQMSELEDVLRDFSVDHDETELSAAELAESATRSLQEEDDNMDDELKQLAMSEQALREELEFTQDMSTVLAGPVTPSNSGDGLPQEKFEPPTPIPMQPLPGETPPRPNRRHGIDPPESVSAEAYTLQEHSDYLRLHTEKTGGWYFCDMTQHMLVDASTGNDNGHAKGLVRDYCLPIPFRKLKRLYSGLMYHPVALVESNMSSASATPSKALNNNVPSTPATPASMASSSKRPAKPPCAPAANSDSPALPIPRSSSSAQPHEEPLPVRTVAIRIRPDVLCGAVMDAVHHAFQVCGNGIGSTTMHILKRQGGHLRGAVYSNSDGDSQALAYVADAQLCTQKNDNLERRLVVRFYHIQDDPEAIHELGQVLQQKQQPAVPPSPGLLDDSLVCVGDDDKGNRHLKQCCSLIQRLMAAQQQKSMDPKQQSSWLGLRSSAVFKSKAAMQRSIGKHLESNFKTCPSVREENKKASPTIRRLTLPSLSSKDWPILQVSWKLTSSILDELDTRDCTYNTLATLAFGQFPSLPTLDVHFCSQLRRLSRESMITHLLKSAKELEDYAKSAEYNCAVCITLLRPMLEYYGIPPIDLPTMPRPLEDYPLDYTPPQVTCPPWGNLVMEALNQVAARTPTGDIDVGESVHKVYDAFCRQDDEEQAARLGRKNAQIMERLSSMQSHQRGLIEHIRDSYVYSRSANQKGEAFLKKSQMAINTGKPGSPRLLQEEVPLLSFRISLGASSSGTCYVTANQILFSTTYIPLVGGTTTNCFDLSLVDFQVDESVTATLLNPFPNTMQVVLKRTGETLYKFRPSMGPNRLHKFLQVIQSFCGETAPSEFSEVDVQVVEEDGVMRLTDRPSEDQLSI